MQRLAINGFICERVKPSEQSSYMGLWVCVALIVLILRAGIRRLLICMISASAIAMAARVVIQLGCDSQCTDSYAAILMRPIPTNLQNRVEARASKTAKING